MGGLLLSSVASAGQELVAFPEGYQDNFTHYATVNRDDERKQVVKAFANDAALASADAGVPLASGSVIAMEVYKAKLDDNEEPIMGDDGFFVADEMAAVALMESRDGFGEDYAEELRNGTWEYALFKADGTRIDKETTACFECHKPLHDTDYVFTLEQLKAAGGS
ncbi:MAG: cytochrome P460 family protein [Geminicoccaceae bacterium]